LQPAVVNISTKQSVQVSRNNGLPPGFEEFFRRFGGRVPQGGQGGSGEGDTVTQRGGSLGSGFIISADGYVVTNNHVISPARNNATVEEITVIMSDRKEYRARLIGRDQASDLALPQDRGDQPAVRPLRRLDAHPRRRLGGSDRQSVRPRRHRHGWHRLGAAPLDPGCGRL
jgi:serine protease Do